MSQFLLLDGLPKLKAETMRYLTRDCDLDGLLGIQITAEYGMSILLFRANRGHLLQEMSQFFLVTLTMLATIVKKWMIFSVMIFTPIVRVLW